jgi:hypothetical protein
VYAVVFVGGLCGRACICLWVEVWGVGLMVEADRYGILGCFGCFLCWAVIW